MSQESLAYNRKSARSVEVFGFWMYIMTDCVLFATLFSTYAVLHTHTYGGPSIGELGSLSYVFVETMLLLVSSFSYGVGMLSLREGKKSQAQLLFALTFLLGLGFVGMEFHEFFTLVQEGSSWARSAALSSFFVLVGTHGLHVTLGLVWMLLLFVQFAQKGITQVTVRRFMCLGLFWHFLDIIWIFVFSVVYLMGALA